MEALEKLRECVVYFDGDDCQGGNIVREVVQEVERIEDELTAARACAEMMLQGTGQKICESMAMRVLDRQWIPVSEQQPEMGRTVMIGSATHGWVGTGHRVLVGEYLHWEDGDGDDMHEPTHWMPLPEPPEVK